MPHYGPHETVSKIYRNGTDSTTPAGQGRATLLPRNKANDLDDQQTLLLSMYILQWMQNEDGAES